MNPLVSVVIAIGGPEAQPRPVIDGCGRALSERGYGCEFVVVLDGPGRTHEQELRELAAHWPLRVVQLEGGGLGESIALSAGVAKATGELVISTPPYLQIEPEDLVLVVKALEAGADCVATWRHSRIDPWLNQVQSRLFNWCLRWIMNMPFHDLNSGTRGFRRKVLEEVAVYGELYRFLPVMARRQGFRVVEVRVRHREERGRAGFYGVGVYLRRLLDIAAITFLTRFTQRPLRFFGYVGFAAALIGLLMAAWPLYERIFESVALTERPLFVLGSILAAFGVQLIGFGLIGEIIIFTQAPNLRDYKIETMVEGGAETSAGAAASSMGPGPALPAGGTSAPAGLGDGQVGRGPAMAPGREPLPSSPRVVPTPAADSHEPLRVRPLLPGEDSRWDGYVRSNPLGTFYHLTGWARAVGEQFGHTAHHQVVERGRKWVGVLPLFLAKSPFLGRNLISVPYGVYGGVLADDDAAQQELLLRAEQLGRELSVGYVELRHLEPRSGERPRSSLYVTFRCDLPENAGEVMNRIPKKARAEVRCAREPAAPAIEGKRRASFGIRVTPDGSVDELFALFAENKRRLGSPALPKRWFQALADEFGKAVVIHRAVDLKGRTLAAVMSFCFKDTVYAYYSGSLTDVNDTGVNNWIYCAIMEWAVEQGYRRFDFGRSRGDSGPAKFKKNMGFEAEPLHYEYMLIGPGAKLPQFHPSNPKLALPRRIWSKMPLLLCNPLGARLSRFLP